MNISLLQQQIMSGSSASLGKKETKKKNPDGARKPPLYHY